MVHFVSLGFTKLLPRSQLSLANLGVLPFDGLFRSKIGSIKSLFVSRMRRRFPIFSIGRLYCTGNAEAAPQLSIDLIKIMDQRLSAIENRNAHLERFLDQPELTPSEYSTANKELRKLRDSVHLISELRAKQQEIKELKSVISDCQDDKDMQQMASEELSEATEGEKKFQFLLLKSLLPKDDADERDCILEVRAGTGGEEASLFAMDIFKMYEKYSVKKGWKYEVLETAESDLKGYKEAIASISGAGVYGKLKFESGIHRVQRVPVTEKGGRVHTSAVSVAILPQADQDRSTGQTIGIGYESQGLYYLTSSNSLIACSVTDSLDVIHKRLGHPSLSKLQKMVPSLSGLSTLDCESCQLGKHTRATFSRSTEGRSESIFSFLHSDILGPSRVSSPLGFRYFVSFIDDYFRCTWVFLMKDRSELFSIFKGFFAEIQNQFGVSIRTFHSDNALEYLSSQFQEFMSHHGIIHQKSCPYTSIKWCRRKKE
ncbi:peptide chain release factor 1-like, mitochondrial isoform X3 [Solanum lycopersicum]|uniref:peptide chain release factor 1-like, mitochondrial isoform X3 n=1 Tax=Solanum lycopersicum TaxID=4081 RepID=UPI000532DC5E